MADSNYTAIPDVDGTDEQKQRPQGDAPTTAYTSLVTLEEGAQLADTKPLSTKPVLLRNAGRTWVYAWGGNSGNSLALGHGSDVHRPQVMETLMGSFDYIVSAKSVTFAVDDEGNLWSWGRTSGSGTTCIPNHVYDVSTPTMVPLSCKVRFTQIAPSPNHCVARTDDGRVFHWGSPYSTLKRDARNASLHTPTEMILPDNHKATWCAAGQYISIVIDENGKMWRWGRQPITVPDANHDSFYTPVPYECEVKMSRVSCGFLVFAAISTKGQLFTWGWHRTASMFGRPGATATETPTIVETTIGVSFQEVHVADTSGHAIDADGHIWSWGQGGCWLGLGEIKTDVTVPTKIVMPNGATFKTISGSTRTRAALSTSGVAYVWGDRNRGVLGQGEELKVDISFPTKVVGIDRPLQILSCGECHCVGLTEPVVGHLGIMEFFFANDQADVDAAAAAAAPAAPVPEHVTAYTPYTDNYGAAAAAATQQIEAYAYGEIDDAALVELPVRPPAPSTYTSTTTEPSSDVTQYTTVELDTVVSSTDFPKRDLPPAGNIYQYISPELPTKPGHVHLDPALRTSADQQPVTATWRNWNEEFQSLISLPMDTSEEKLERVTQIAQFYDQFVDRANEISKVIVTEAVVPVAQKTYKPLQIGGVAGGEKYIVDGIFFKFAVDLHGIYGGDEWSRKAANLELLGLDAYAFCQSQVPNLRFPLTTVVDYKGYRLVVTSVLPVTKTSLVYGSDDGGRSCKRDSAQAVELMDQCGQILNLKRHLVTDKEVEIRAPCDIEVHQGKDDRVYVLDTARVFPPEFPFPLFGAIKLGIEFTTFGSIDKLEVDRQQLKVLVHDMKCLHTPEGLLYCKDEGQLNKLASAFAGVEIFGEAYLLYGLEGRILYYQLRPEFVRNYSVPLSSDACSMFGKHDKDVHNNEIKSATVYLKQTVIPKFAQQIQMGELIVSTTNQLTEEMHAAGINLRYLGLLRAVVDSPRLQNLIFTEMIVRCMKNFVKRRLRRVASSESLTRRTALRVFNLIFGDSDGANYYWTQILKIQLGAKYSDGILGDEKARNHDLRHRLNKASIFSLLQDQTGVIFTKSVTHRYEFEAQSFKVPNPFVLTDIEDICPTTKRLHLGNVGQITKLASQIGGRKDEPRAAELNEEEEATHVAVWEHLRTTLGPGHTKIAQHQLQHAIRYTFAVNWNPEKAQLYLDKGKDILLQYDYIPVELALAVLYLEGAIAYAKGDTVQANRSLERALRASVKASCNGLEDVVLILRDHDELFISFHPLYLFVLNIMWQLWNDKTETCTTNYEWSKHYQVLWDSYCFPGDAEARKNIFGFDVPLPLVNVFLVNTLVTAGIFSAYENPKFASKFTHLGNLPLSDPKTRQWLDSAICLDNTTRQSVAVAWITNKPHSDLDSETTCFTSISVPYLVAKDAPLEATVRQSGNPQYRFVEVRRVEFDRHNLQHTFKLPEKVPLLPDQTTVDLSNLTKKCGAYGVQIQKAYSDTAQKSVTVVEGKDLDKITTYLVDVWITSSYNILPIDPADKFGDICYYSGTREYGFAITREGVLLSTPRSDLAWTGHPKTQVSDYSQDFIPVHGLIAKKIVKHGDGWYGCQSDPPKAISSWNHQFSFALASSGELYSWGMNSTGALGMPGQDYQETPKIIPQLYGVKLVDAAVGTALMVALSEEGKTYLWGENWCLITSDQIGYYNSPYIRTDYGKKQIFNKTPTAIKFPKNDDCKIVSIAAGLSHAIFVTDYGDFYYLGQTYQEDNVAVELTLCTFADRGIRIQKASCGWRHTLLLSEDGKVFTFGSNKRGQMGTVHGENVDWSPDLKPIELVRFGQFKTPKIVQIHAACHTSVVLDENNHLWVWGHHKYAPVKLELSLNFKIGSFSLSRSEQLILSPMPPHHAPVVPFIPKVRPETSGDAPQAAIALEAVSKLATSIATLKEEMQNLLKPILDSVKTLNERVDRIDRRLTNLEKRVK